MHSRPGRYNTNIKNIKKYLKLKPPPAPTPHVNNKIIKDLID